MANRSQKEAQACSYIIIFDNFAERQLFLFPSNGKYPFFMKRGKVVRNSMTRVEKNNNKEFAEPVDK